MSEKLLIHGGHRLEGEVTVSGGKNAAVAVIPAALLADSPCRIDNLPDINDVHVLIDMLRWLGAKVERVYQGKCNFGANAVGSGCTGNCGSCPGCHHE